MKRSIWIARHAVRLDTEDPNWSKIALYPHDTPLSDIGHQQAKKLAKKVSKLDIAHIFCSPFLRARQTAEHCAKAIKKHINYEDGLHEWINITDKVEIEFINIYSWYQGFWRIPIQRESQQTMEERMGMVGRALLRWPGNLLIITHGSPAKALIEKISRVPNVSIPKIASLYHIQNEEIQ